MFIRRKIVRGVPYFTLVESYRSRGRIRQKTFFSLGRHASFDAAIESESKKIVSHAGCTSLISECESRIADLRHWQQKHLDWLKKSTLRKKA